MSIWENVEADGTVVKEEERESDCVIPVKAGHQQCQLLPSGRGKSRGGDLLMTVATVTRRFTK